MQARSSPCRARPPTRQLIRPQTTDSSPIRAAGVAAGLACLIGASALLAPGASGESGSDRAIGKLRQQQCPELALTREKTYNDREVALARRGRFVIAGDRVKLKPKVNWFKNHRTSREFQEQLHSLRWMDVLFQAYREGDRRAMLNARRLAVDWVEQNPLRQRKLAVADRGGKGKGKGKGKGNGKGKGRPRPKPVPPLAWQNLVAGYRASYLGYLTRAAACEGNLPKRPARTLLKSVKEHGRYLATGDGYYRSNHGLFTDLGLFLLADRYFPFLSTSAKWESIARDRFPRTLAGRTSNSGFWLEHSADYHFLAIRMAKTFLHYAGPDPRIRASLDRLEDAAPWFVAPDGRYPLIGDTSAGRAPVEYRKPASAINGYRTFLDAGVFVVRRGKRYLAVTAGFHNGSHKQSDELGFELFDRDTRVVTGPGKYGFDRNEKRAYVLSNAAHSVLTIDKQPWPRDGTAAYGSGLIASGSGDQGWFAVLGRNPLAERRGVSHRRLFVYHPLVGLFIFDTLDSRSGRHKYRRYVQFGEDVTVRRENKRGLKLGAKRRKREFDGCLRDEASPEVGSILRLDRGRRNPLEGWTFPRTGSGIPRWTATMRSKAADVSHLYGIGLQRGCPFSVRRVPSAGLLDFVLTRENHKDVQVSVSQAGGDLFVSETEVEGPLPPVPPAPPIDPIYGESPSG